MDLVSRLAFPRVVGTDGEQRGFLIIQESLATFGVRAWFEEFSTPWIEIDRAELELGDERVPIESLADPVFNGPWIPIPCEVDQEGVLVDSIDVASAERQVLLRTSLDITEPCVTGASAQLLACTPEDGFVAYYLADVSGHGTPVPSAYVEPERLAFLLERLGSACRVRWTSARCERILRNLVAEVRGTERPEEVVAVGAHIDSFPGTVGANDNASGCARLVEFARWFTDHPPARTMRFIWFTGEELDRRGSRAYVQAHVEDRDRICLFINVDGGVSIEHERPAVNIEDCGAMAAVVSKALEAALPGEGSMPFRRAAQCADGSDATSFHEAGIPAMLAPGGGKRKKTGPNPHLPTDTVERLDPENVRRATVLALAFVDVSQRCGQTAPSS